MSTQQSGLVSGNSQNSPGGSTPRSRSKFPLSYSQFQTERFAEYTPFFVQEGVSGDILPLHSNHEVQTYTLKSPILQSLSKKKDYFVVPMQAILPLNWEKFYTNPNIGQDVPVDCGLGVVGFWSKMKTCIENSWTTLGSTLSGNGTNAAKLQAVLKFLLFFENIYSAGSLMETLRISGHNWFRAKRSQSGVTLKADFDGLFDEFIGVIETYLGTAQVAFVFTLGGVTYEVSANTDMASSTAGSPYTAISLREALELMRDDLSFTITSASSFVSGFSTIYGYYSLDLPTSDSDLNLGRLWAYQLVVAHFYSNDHVDFIYSADLYRQYILQLVTFRSVANNQPDVQNDASFRVNGLDYIYDALSAFYCNRVLSRLSGSAGIYSVQNLGQPQNDGLDECYAYFVSLFSFKRSLRFLDYFTGSRTFPLAIGNSQYGSSVSVNNNAVDIIDLAKHSMATKFLQAVNRSGRKFSAYMKELFGKTPAYDYHNPMYLAHTSDLVGAPETDNTGDAQVNTKLAVTSRFRATSSRYAFEFRPDRDCVVLGIGYYDLPRVYLRSTDAQNFYVNRFDMFNPYLQFIGDQPITRAEIGTDSPSSAPFSYTNRHMEYKQRFNVAAGGFCVPSTQLDNWIFPADLLRRRNFTNISPSFIRSFNSELDRFYQRLTGYSLATYFHFIIRYDNRQDASRPMAYNPTINI